MNEYRDRGLVGYGPQPPDPECPGGARIAINFVLNQEEKSKCCVLNGDPHQERALSDLSALEPIHGTR